MESLGEKKDRNAKKKKNIKIIKRKFNYDRMKLG